MPSKVIAGLLFLSAFLPLEAREAFLQTRDGRVFQGHVRFESNTVIVVSAERLLREVVALTNLAGLTFLSRRDVEPVGSTLSQLGSGDLPARWQGGEVGSLGRGGGSEYRGQAFRIRSSGTNLIGTADACHWVYQPVSDRSEIVARISKAQATDPWARAGLMMRESFDPGSRSIAVTVSAARGGVFQWRDRVSGETEVSLDSSMAVPVWLKLKREGDEFTAFKSRNGIQWTLVDKATVRMSATYYAGLAGVAVRPGARSESVFEYVQLGRSVRNRWFAPEVELVSGSCRRSYIESMDDTSILFDDRLGRDALSRASVANIRFQPVPSRWSAPLNQNLPGVVLATGEFVEGDCRGIVEGRVKISSVPLGLVDYDINSEVLALILRARAAPARHHFGVELNDGSRWVGQSLGIEPLGVTLQEPNLGRRFFYLHEIAEIRRRP